MDLEKLNNEKPNFEKEAAYTKPIITQVRLIAEETVLALCKTGSAAGRNDCLATGGYLTCVRDSTS